MGMDKYAYFQADFQGPDGLPNNFHDSDETFAENAGQFLSLIHISYETADVISTYVYRLGIEQADYGVSTAMGLFNSVVGFIFVFAANKLSNKINGTGLW